MIGVGGSLGRRSIGTGGGIGGDGAHGPGPTTMTLTTVDSSDPVMTAAGLVYTFTVTNTGGNSLANLSLAITYDTDSTYVSSSAGTFTSIGESAGVVTATIATVAPAGTAVCTVTVTTPATTQTLSLSASATADNATTANDTETTSVLLVTKDAASSQRVPDSAAEWTSVGSILGFTVDPFLLWKLQETSGNFADSIGAFTGTAGTLGGGSYYAQTVSGWTRKAVKLLDNTGEFVRNLSGSLPNLASESCMMLWYGDVPGSHVATDMQMNIMGQAVQCGFLRKANNDNITCQFTNLDTQHLIMNSAGGQVRPYLLQYDRTNSKNMACVDGAGMQNPAFMTTATGSWFWLGSGLTPGMTALYCVGFRGTNAELTNTQIKALLQLLGWTVTWTP